ncbi:MAG TPA: FKBP-type peptidyl-prolyl cis-trans isomerase [Solirubrobacterales bacterium]|nr:FKBP-type peptidyl-prolyl cis-trans isomerase [Solirubrobacterales bacterium]
MRVCGLVLAFALTVVLLGCGGNGEADTSVDTGPGDRTVTETVQAKKPEYPAPKIPAKRGPLEKLVVRDLEVGTGPVARWGDVAVVRYVGVYWQTKLVLSEHWASTLTFKLDGKKFGPGWQKGIEGMRVGGRREILIPGPLLFEGGEDAAYVVGLDKVKPGS